MAKKARRPDEPYNVIDADGIFIDSFSKVSKARRYAATAPDPLRVYKLVTLEEVAVIRAAQRWYDAETASEFNQAESALEYAVEVSRG